MKIKEFIEKVNLHYGMWAAKVDKNIVIGTLNSMGIFLISEDATNPVEIDTCVGAMKKSQYWEKADREYLSALIEEFLHTPVKKRSLEKKYRLGTGPVGIKQYVTGLQVVGCCVAFNYGTKENAKEWTDTTLHGLSKYFSKEVIECMKEPVEDK